MRRSLLLLVFAGFTAFTAGTLPASRSAGAVQRQRTPRGRRGTTKGTRMHVYVGTYTQRGSKGIYQFDFDLASGRATGATEVAETPNPSFLAITPDRQVLVAVNETETFNGEKSGSVSSFHINPDTGGLMPLNQQASGGTAPCYVAIDSAGRNALVANYGSGSVAALPIGLDGRLAPASSVIQHHGTSADPQRQEGPHAHSIVLDGANRRAYAADLGLDKVLIYRFDSEEGKLTPNDPPFASVAPGSGPRHSAFTPDGRYLYVISEMKSTVTAFRHDATTGALTSFQTISTLPEGFTGSSSTAEIAVHPSGRFLYGSNRGHDSIAIFTIDRETGRLTAAGRKPTGGKTPRNFEIDPTGAYLLAANQDSDDIFIFRIDPDTGQLKRAGQRIQVPMPVCIDMTIVAASK